MTDMLTTPQAAKLIGRSAVSLRRWRMEGRGPEYVKVNASVVLYDRKDVEAWCREHLPVPDKYLT